MIYDVAFRNVSPTAITSIDFLWEAFGKTDRPSYVYRSQYDGAALRSGDVQFEHDVDRRFSDDIARYRLSVRRVNFAAGTEWNAPPLFSPETR